MAQEEKRKLEQTIDDFKKKKINVIVSTSVLEEGMDISRCNLVVRFDPIPEFRSYVQVQEKFTQNAISYSEIFLS